MHVRDSNREAETSGQPGTRNRGPFFFFLFIFCICAHTKLRKISIVSSTNPVVLKWGNAYPGGYMKALQGAREILKYFLKVAPMQKKKLEHSRCPLAIEIDKRSSVKRTPMFSVGNGVSLLFND